jgi:hypothetical protein
MTTHRIARGSFLALCLVSLSGCPGPTTPAGDSGPETDSGPGHDGGSVEDTGVPPTDTGVPPTDSGTPTPDAWSLAPAFRNPHPEIADADLARMALRILGSPAAGATTTYCNECHSLSRGRIRYWRALSDESMANCLTDLSVSSDASAASMITCLGGAGGITTDRLGIWATASSLPWFTYVFEHGVATDPTGAHAAFVDSAGMPPSPDHVAMTQDQFDIVAEWFLRGVPELDSVIPADSAPTECLPGVTADVLAHVAEMETMGWSARNRAAGMMSYGCAGAATPEDCLSAEPLASATSIPHADQWATVATGGVAGAHLRVLYTTDYESAWWTRSSPDGRFVSHGASRAPNLRFIDLQGDRVIGGAGDYDTFFFPDGTGFITQGSAPRLCENRVLYTGSPTMLTFTEAGCSAGTGIALYEHLGASLDGGDYWAIASNGGETAATYDNGGNGTSPTRRQPIAGFPATASSRLTLMTNDGTRFVVNGHADISHPYEGDATISPSVRLMVTRSAGPGDVSIGYVLHRLEVSGSGSSISVSAPEIGRYCITGAKPAFSLDERFMAIHHYVTDADAVELGFTGSSDPAFAEYRTLGSANVYLVDLTTGAQYRITNMGPGQYALFPHFRSDGWMYFMVRTQAATPEHVVASDAPLLLAH